MILESHGEVAARICSILDEKGHLEADAIAETAMVPEKDTREVRFIVSALFCVGRHKPSNTAHAHTI